jgi:hypothetical protein
MPSLPILPSQYQTRIEANIVDKNFTATAVEYYDGFNNRASLLMIQQGIQQSLIFDYANDQLFYVDPTCKT